ncbi:hypothetical protein C2G38_2223275 [Gigaspora rosea]|uniref:Uncharacterized protein n=1 Tax=Gigaspora rosea TaxID=44941 RepID=A0A397UAG1_9GLOM|nr:hypothetical protein C2G38_2223275 [Gigaspora rosea]
MLKTTTKPQAPTTLRTKTKLQAPMTKPQAPMTPQNHKHRLKARAKLQAPTTNKVMANPQLLYSNDTKKNCFRPNKTTSKKRAMYKNTIHNSEKRILLQNNAEETQATIPQEACKTTHRTFNLEENPATTLATT